MWKLFFRLRMHHENNFTSLAISRTLTALFTKFEWGENGCGGHWKVEHWQNCNDGKLDDSSFFFVFEVQNHDNKVQFFAVFCGFSAEFPSKTYLRQ